MITRKRWTPEEDAFLLKCYNGAPGSVDLGLYETDDEIFEAMSNWTEFKTRTKAAIQKRYYDLTNAGKERKYIRKDEQYSSFLESIQTLKTSYDAMVIENRQLKKRVAELEDQGSDYEALVSIIERARNIALSDIPVAPNGFRMDRNGNLELVK